jgi:prophage tail gpP-like protein
MKPVHIIIAGQLFRYWKTFNLKRSRKDLTGSLSFDFGFVGIPNSPLHPFIISGAEISCYVGGRLAFTGTIDKRAASGDAKNYSCKITCRGKTKQLINSSHKHEKGMKKKTKTKEAIDELVQPFGVNVKYESEDNIEMERIVFRDGMPVYNEIHRLTREHNKLAFEAVDGTLLITEDSKGGNGQDLIVGKNVIKFNTEQSEEDGNSEITVKGQRTGMEYQGNEAINRKVVHQDPMFKNYSPLTVQLVGDASDERMEARLKMERARQVQDSRSVTFEVFYVQDDGSEWDLNKTHYTEISSESLFTEMVVTELEYQGSPTEISTSITLSPKAEDEGNNKGQFRMSQLNINKNGQYPLSWSVLPIINSPNLVSEVIRQISPPKLLPEYIKYDNV